MWQWESNMLAVYIVLGQEAARIRQECLYPSKAHLSWNTSTNNTQLTKDSTAFYLRASQPTEST